MFESRKWMLAGLVSVQCILALSSSALAQTAAANEAINGNGPKFIMVERGALLPDGKVMKSDSRIAYIDADAYFVPSKKHLHWGKVPPHYFDSLYGQNPKVQLSSKKATSR